MNLTDYEKQELEKAGLIGMYEIAETEVKQNVTISASIPITLYDEFSRVLPKRTTISSGIRQLIRQYIENTKVK